MTLMSLLFLWLTAHGQIPEPRPLMVPKALMQKLKSFEPSGSIFLRDLNQYLVVCDDTDKRKSPLLFLVNSDGEVSEQPMNIEGVRKLTDMESISQDDQGHIYVLSSLGLNKRGEESFARNLLVPAVRKGKTLTAKKIVELRPLLIEAIKRSELPDLRSIRGRIESELDVESHFIKDQILYIGLKTPQPRPGVALILSLGDIQSILDKKLDLKLWRKIDFGSPEADLISEMLAGGEWFSTTTETGASRLWRWDEQTAKPLLVRTFPLHRLEGLARDSRTQNLLLLFDQGDGPPHYMFHKIH